MRINYGQLALERRFKEQKRAAMLKARDLGHDPNWVYDDTVEGALWCDDCGLWGRVVISPVSAGGKERDDIGGAILEHRCEDGILHKVHGEEARRIVKIGADYTLPSMFAEIGVEPKEVRREVFKKIPAGKIGEDAWFNGRNVGGRE